MKSYTRFLPSNKICYKNFTEIYTRKTLSLDGATIGGHTRHIIRFLEILLNSYYSNKINYDKRQRNLELEEKPQKPWK